jgi:hypothetical protein
LQIKETRGSRAGVERPIWETSGLQSQIGGGGTFGAPRLAVRSLRDVTRGMTRVILRHKWGYFVPLGQIFDRLKRAQKTL